MSATMSRLPNFGLQSGVKLPQIQPKKLPELVSHETDEEIDQRIRDRFQTLETLTQGVLDGNVRSLTVAGPAGLGKSFTIESMLDLADNPSEITKGFARATGLYKLFYQYREPGNIVVFDDCDSIFEDIDKANMLKAAMDTTERRFLSWRAETKMEDSEGDPMPTKFEYEGSAIFISNKDFDTEIDRGSKLAPHLEAVMDRSYYIDLGMKTRRDYFIRIKQIIHLLPEYQSLTSNRQEEVLDFIHENMDKFRTLSIRTAKSISLLATYDPHWKRTALVTKTRQR